VHTFHPHSYYLALFAAPPRNVPVVFTAVWYLMPIPFPAYRGRVIFVAEEFRDQAARYFRNYPREIAVIPNRIDLGMYHPDIDHTRFQEERRLTASGWKIAFMSRIDHTKLGSLRHAVDAMGILASRGREVVLAVAGGGTMFEDLSRYVDRVNGQAGQEIVVLLGPVLETPQLLSWADVVLGIGRCAWEGMACGKPTLVVGENGFAGVVEPGSVDELAYYNFAGRNRNSPAEPALLADTIERIMAGGSDYRRLSQFARDYVLEHYDYRTGAERLERMYEAALGDPPLGRGERVRLKLENVLFGYGCRALVAWRLKLRGLIGRGRPEDGLHVDVVQD
jgi:glycosyltransferase involved in cell wall biosynthesis